MAIPTTDVNRGRAWETTAIQDPAVLRRQLRAELRRARAVAELTQAEVAHAMDWSPSKLIRIERGDVSVSTNDLKALLGHYGVQDKEKVNGLLELAKSARAASFYDQYADQLKPGFKEYLAYEATASVIRQYELALIPGLLQTEEYARRILADMVGLGPDEVDKAWTVRRHRQDAVDRDGPPEMRYVLDEGALRRHVGRAPVMRHQLARLKEATAEPHITIQVIPLIRGAHPGMAGSFILLEFADPNLADLLHLEHINQTTIRDDTKQIAHYLDRFAQLEELALPEGESAGLLDALIEEMRSSALPTNDTEKGQF